MNAMAADLLGDGATLEQISAALKRCRKECRFPVRLPDIWQRIPGREVPQAEAEMRAAWDIVVRYAGKWLRWNPERTNASPDADAPKLPQRSVDCVRRSGGWDVYLTMNHESAPFIQKRFFEEWQAWTATEPIVHAQVKALSAPQLKQLPERKQMEKPRGPIANLVQMRNVSQEPMTAEQIRDRRAILKQQLERVIATRA